MLPFPTHSCLLLLSCHFVVFCYYVINRFIAVTTQLTITILLSIINFRLNIIGLYTSLIIIIVIIICKFFPSEFTDGISLDSV